MAASGRSAVRRTGRILTGFGALVVLCAVLVGAPVALLALAGNPLPDHLPTVAEVGSTLTSRDDGRLFLRALALAGWFGWATFAFSVLLELCAQVLRRPAPRLPGMSRQQRAAAALVGSVALILAASPAASAATAMSGPYALPAAPAATGVEAAWPGAAAHTAWAAPAVEVARPASAARPLSAALPAQPPTTVEVAWPAATASSPSATAAQPAASSVASYAAATSDEGTAVYRVARGDHLGAVAQRYLDEFADYRELAALNRLGDPDRIHPGQLLKLPGNAEDGGARRHATGRLVARPTPPAPARPAPQPAPGQAAPDRAIPPPPAAEAPVPPPAKTNAGEAPTVTVGAARAGEPDRVNRPLAVSAVLAVASIVGAQIGAVLGLRRRPGHVPAGAGRTTSAARGGTLARRGTTTTRRGTGHRGAGDARGGSAIRVDPGGTATGAQDSAHPTGHGSAHPAGHGRAGTDGSIGRHRRP
ncbi:LysM peptidoglycan-binding domain-containing protein [Micromonospora sp. C31]|uniref:LysM peptidoglycan-binding domain-containing protein n=1 Tax=Micromonospora sp. C31 TaxID=2824876 RepID=UPI001B35CC93|nr:LysM domain-containing protein [Micromonospora sp. C31]MBQ1076107.1 LysM peptidoglycan-binding domain-containing protein [Micromonospora sp. C31]